MFQKNLLAVSIFTVEKYSILKMETTGSSETLVFIYKIQHHIPEDSNFQLVKFSYASFGGRNEETCKEEQD
jgi:hypothetical protein